VGIFTYLNTAFIIIDGGSSQEASRLCTLRKTNYLLKYIGEHYPDPGLVEI